MRRVFFYFLAKRGWGEWPTLDFLGFFGLSGRCARQQGETLVVGYKWTVAGLSRPFIWLFIWCTWKTDYYISLLDSDKIVTFERKISGRYKLKGGVFKNRSYSVDGFGVEARPAHKLSFHELVVTGRRIKELDPTTATRQIYPLVSNQDVLYLCRKSEGAHQMYGEHLHACWSCTRVWILWVTPLWSSVLLTQSDLKAMGSAQAVHLRSYTGYSSVLHWSIASSWPEWGVQHIKSKNPGGKAGSSVLYSICRWPEKSLNEIGVARRNEEELWWDLGNQILPIAWSGHDHLKKQ